MVPLLALLLALSPAASASSVAGLYEIDQMEMGGGLELKPDGRFRYALEYGAVSERGEGKWAYTNGRVELTSDPMPKAPAFEVVEDRPAAKGQLFVRLAEPGFGDWGGRLRLLVGLNGYRELFEIEAAEDGRVPTQDTPVTEVLPLVPVYGPVSDPIWLSPDRGHRLLLRFVPNDLGKARFNHEPLSISNEGLVMQRYDAKVVFRPTH
jgi:hypothetical protein